MVPKNAILKVYLFLVHISDSEWIYEILYVMQLRHITAGNIVQAVTGWCFFLHRWVAKLISFMWRKQTIVYLSMRLVKESSSSISKLLLTTNHLTQCAAAVQDENMLQTIIPMSSVSVDLTAIADSIGVSNLRYLRSICHLFPPLLC